MYYSEINQLTIKFNGDFMKKLFLYNILLMTFFITKIQGAVPVAHAIVKSQFINQIANEIASLFQTATMGEHIQNATKNVQHIMRNNISLQGEDPAYFTALRMLMQYKQFPQIPSNMIITPSLFSYKDTNGKTLLDYTSTAPYNAPIWQQLISDMQSNFAPVAWENYKILMLNNQQPTMDPSVFPYLFWRDSHQKSLFDYAQSSSFKTQWTSVLNQVQQNWYLSQANAIYQLFALKGKKTFRWPIVYKPTEPSYIIDETNTILQIILPVSNAKDYNNKITTIQILSNLAIQMPIFYCQALNAAGAVVGIGSTTSLETGVTIASFVTPTKENPSNIEYTTIDFPDAATIINSQLNTANKNTLLKVQATIFDYPNLFELLKNVMGSTNPNNYPNLFALLNNMTGPINDPNLLELWKNIMKSQPNHATTIPLGLLFYKDQNEKQLIDYAPSEQWTTILRNQMDTFNFNQTITGLNALIQTILIASPYSIISNNTECMYDRNGIIRYLKISAADKNNEIQTITTFSQRPQDGGNFIILGFDKNNKIIGYNISTSLSETFTLTGLNQTSPLYVKDLTKELGQYIAGIKNPLSILVQSTTPATNDQRSKQTFIAGVNNAINVRTLVLQSIAKPTSGVSNGIHYMIDNTNTTRLLIIPATNLGNGISAIQVFSAMYFNTIYYFFIALNAQNIPVAFAVTKDISQPITFFYYDGSTTTCVIENLNKELNTSLYGIKHALKAVPLQTTTTPA